jgi:hypothetical protein
VRWMLIGVLFNSAAWALDPTVGPSAAASPVPATSPSVAASPVATASPAVAYPTAVATTVAYPTPLPDPTAAAYSSAATYASPEPARQDAAPTSDARTLSGAPHILDFKPAWGAALRGGLALPLEGQTAANSLGTMTGLDAFYHGTENSTLDLLGLYASMPTIGEGTPSPLSSFGLAVKLDYDVYQDEQTSVWVGAGAGYMEIRTTDHIVADPGVSPTTYRSVPQSSGGLVLLGCVGAGYTFVPQWSLNLEILVTSLDSMDGTSNNLLAALPDFYVKWMY